MFEGKSNEIHFTTCDLEIDLDLDLQSSFKVRFFLMGYLIFTTHFYSRMKNKQNLVIKTFSQNVTQIEKLTGLK